jgi:hypothetical protein
MSTESFLTRKVATGIAVLTAAAVLSLGISRSSADIDRTRPACIQLSSQSERPIVADAGGYSLSTGEQLDSGGLYLEANIERSDGQEHPTFGAFPRGVYVFKTTSGRYVIRILDHPPGFGWYGPF